ncbi:cysteine desulfurase family protein [Nocardioides speluncae]|uniref:cysteine desulfurase family protein n=1 Tax=Nocardioides speluncae TaxID=2670337 RepID=UPI00197F8202|nr:cysteine desulfurase family protein [Nocardioides speluncae]
MAPDMAPEAGSRPSGLRNGPIFLDYNATTPVDPRVIAAALPYLTEHFGNPSSTHYYGHTPRQAIRQARREVADLLGAQTDEIVFTAGGSDSDTLAIRGAALANRDANRDRGDHVITQATEHPAVLEACRSLQSDGFRVTILPVDHHGQVDPADLEQAITGDTTLVSIMLANAETGTLQPISRLARIAHAHGALFHTDAAQAAGKIPIDMTELGVDLLTVVGHKMYAPKGVGALYVRAGTRLQPTIHGGGQEQGLRAGTENVALIAAFGAASRIAADSLPQSAHQLLELRDRLHRQLTELLPDRVSLNGHPEHRLPGTLNVSISNTRGADVLAAAPGIAAATGSACHEGTDEPSPVLTAMGQPPDHALAALRLSFGRWTTASEVDQAAQLIADGVAHLASRSQPQSPRLRHVQGTLGRCADDF